MAEGNGILGIDIGGTNIRMGIVFPDGRIERFQKDDCRSVLQGENSPGIFVRYVADYIERERERCNLLAVSVGVPSTVDRRKRKVISAPNIKGFNNLDLADLMEAELRLPVYLDRDVNMVFRFDRERLALPNYGVGIGCYIGTGIGNVIAVDGKLLVGKNGSACELGHVPVMGRYEKCSCGNVGCCENYASGRYLDMMLSKRKQGTVAELIRSPEFAETLDEFVDNISIVVATEVNILDPEYVILGGGVLLNDGFPIEKLKKRIIEHCRTPYPQQGLKLYTSIEANHSGVIGAALYARDRLKEEGKL